MARGLGGKDEIGHIEDGNVPGQESTAFQGAVPIDGQVELSARQAPVGRIAVAGGHRRVFEPVVSLPPFFDLLPFDVKMVPADEHLPVIDRSGPGGDVEVDPVALKNVLVALDVHIPLGKRLVRSAVERYRVGLQNSPGKGDQDLPNRGHGVFIPVIGEAIRFDGDRSLGDILLQRPTGGNRRQEENEHECGAANTPSPQHDPAPLIAPAPSGWHPIHRPDKSS